MFINKFKGSKLSQIWIILVVISAFLGLGLPGKTFAFTLEVTKVGSGSGTVTSDPAGINCGSSCASQQYFYSWKPVVKLTAVPDSGLYNPSIFLGWSGCDSVDTQNRCLIAMTEDKTFLTIPDGNPLDKDIKAYFLTNSSLVPAIIDEVFQDISAPVCSSYSKTHITTRDINGIVSGLSTSNFTLSVDSVPVPVNPAQQETGDITNQLSNWNLQEISTTNTDRYSLYWELIDVTGTRTVKLYKSSAKLAADLVAEGALAGDGTVTLSAQNSSALSGTVDVTYSADDTDAGNALTHSFITNSSADISVAMLMDYSGGNISGSQNLLDMQLASRGFIAAMPQSQIEIIKYNTIQEVVQPFTNDKTALDTAINDSWFFEGSTEYALRDTLFQALTDVSVQQGMRGIIAVVGNNYTTGTDTSELVSDIDTVVLSALAAGTPIFPVVLGSGMDTLTMYDLQRIAYETGGQYYAAAVSSDLPNIYEDIATLLKSQYTITFPKASVGVHTLSVDVTGVNPPGSTSRNYTVVTCPVLTVDTSGDAAGYAASDIGGISITHVANGSESAQSSPITFGADVNVYANLVDPNSGFTWTGGLCAGGNTDVNPCVVTMDSDNTIGVVFQAGSNPANQRILTITKTGSGIGTVTSTPWPITWNGAIGTATYNNNDVVVLSAAATSGSTFTGWSGEGCSGTGTCTVLMSAARNVTATFQGNLLTVNKTGIGSGNVTVDKGSLSWFGNTGTATYINNDVVTLTATADLGYTFSGWEGEGCFGSDTCAVTMTSARNVSATFSGPQLIVGTNIYWYSFFSPQPITSDKGSLVSMSAPNGSNPNYNYHGAEYLYNEVVTLTPHAPDGYAFAGWDGACSGTQPICTVQLTENTVVLALFSQLEVMLTVTMDAKSTGTGQVISAPAGIDCGTECSTGVFAQNNVVTLTATPDPGARFDGWGIPANTTYDGCYSVNSADQCIVLMGMFDNVVTAKFTDLSIITPSITSVDTSLCSTSSAVVVVTGVDTDRIRSLTEADFTVIQDGLAVTPITVVPNASNYAVSIAMDHDNSAVLSSMKNAAKSMISSLGPDDEAEVIKFNDHVEIVQPLTTDEVQLNSAVDAGWPYDETNISFSKVYDALFQSITDVSARSDYRKMVLVLTNNRFDTSNRTAIEVKNLAIETQTSIVGIFFAFNDEDINNYELNTLRGMAAATGGKIFVAHSADDLTAISLAINALMAEQFIYTVTYPETVPAGSHTVQISVNQPKPQPAGEYIYNNTSTCVTLTVNATGDAAGNVVSNTAGISLSHLSNGHESGVSVPIVPNSLVNVYANLSDPNSAFAWSGACAGNADANPCAITMDQSKVLDVAFTSTLSPTQYILTATKTGAGVGNITANIGILTWNSNIGTATFNSGDVVTLTASPDSHSTFTGWGGDCSGIGTCTVTMNAAANVTANFDAKVTYDLTIVKTGAGSGTVTADIGSLNWVGNTGTGIYNADDVVILTANPGNTSSFNGWTGCPSANGQTCTVTMNFAVTVSVSFIPKPYTLTVNRVGTGSGAVIAATGSITWNGSTGTATYSGDDLVALTAISDTGSVFTGWSGSCQNTGVTCYVSMNADKSVSAHYIQENTSSYSDVASTSSAAVSTEALFNNSVSSGCTAGQFCPSGLVTRSQMAVMIMKSAGLSPAVSCAGNVYSDVNSSLGDEACRYIEKFKDLNITVAGDGCVDAGYFCPNTPVARGIMAEYILRVKGISPAATCSGTEFGDVNTSTFAGRDLSCRYVEKFGALGFSTTCGSNNYCADSWLIRSEMAVFLNKAFLEIGNACGSTKVKNFRTALTYSSIEAALADSGNIQNNDRLLLNVSTLVEAPTVGNAVSIMLEGGYDCIFNLRNWTSTLNGRLSVGDGSATVDGLGIR